MNKTIKIYSVFHLNLSFSSIEERDRPVVIERCYWPLLRLIKDGYPLSVEASGLTLEQIRDIDPKWIDELRALIHSDKTEFIGSGYAQIIGPLVPYIANRKNIELGMQVYQELLGITPHIALVSEMAYSPSLVDLYLEAGFKAILMDWANPYSQNSENWDYNWRYYPQRATSTSGKTIKLIWLDSIPFQRFQRYVHGEIDVDDLLEFIEKTTSSGSMAFPLYGNDAEIFDYRPGRFEAEPELAEESEWGRIGALLDVMSEHERCEFVHPSAVLALTGNDNGDHELKLESANDPIPVKKQPKYNIMRWSATGRDDVWANTACWRVFNRLREDPSASPQQWKTLCRLWGSDYRTHITESRWRDFNLDLADAGAFSKRSGVFRRVEDALRLQMTGLNSVFQVQRSRRNIIIQAPCGTLNLRLLRGLAIEGFWPNGDDQSLVRTLPHGYFSDINWGADFYSGHLVAQIVGRPQVTDLEKVDPSVFYDPDNRFIDLEAHIETLSGPVFKRIRLYAEEPRIEVSYRINWIENTQGSIHIGNITLNPPGFDRSKLFYAVHNGGQDWERHSLAEHNVDHMRAPSFMVSARAGMGMTEGKVIIGDDKRQILVECPREVVAMPALLTCKTVPTWQGKSYFCRLALSTREIDDTARPGPNLPVPGRSEYTYSITALKDHALGR